MDWNGEFSDEKLDFMLSLWHWTVKFTRRLPTKADCNKPVCLLDVKVAAWCSFRRYKTLHGPLHCLYHFAPLLNGCCCGQVKAPCMGSATDSKSCPLRYDCLQGRTLWCKEVRYLKPAQGCCFLDSDITLCHVNFASVFNSSLTKTVLKHGGATSKPRASADLK